MDSLVVDIGTSGASNQYPLIRRTYEQIERWQENGTTGRPTDYALYDKQIRLWVIPDDAYTLNLSYRAKLDELTAGSSNAWTTIGGELIKRRAEANVALNVLQDRNRAGDFKLQEQDLLRELRSEHARRVMTGYSRKRR